MNTRIRTILAQAMAVGAAVLLAQSAQSQVVYQNISTLDGNFNYGNGAYAEAGNEIVLAGGTIGSTTTKSFFISTASIQFDLGQGTSTLNSGPSGNEEMEFNMYENNNSQTFNGYTEPALPLYSSGFFTLSSVGLSTFTDGAKLTFTVNTAVPADFTWTVAFEGLATGEAAGLALYTSPTVGGNYKDAWVNTGTIAIPNWVLDVPTGSLPTLQFGATFSAPEPSTVALGVMGACAFLVRFRRK